MSKKRVNFFKKKFYFLLTLYIALCYNKIYFCAYAFFARKINFNYVKNTKIDKVLEGEK